MTIGPGYACADCRVMLRPRKNDVNVLIDADGPYQIWSADLWECPECRAQIILGYGARPWAVRHQPGFEEYLERVDITIDGKLRDLPAYPPHVPDFLSAKIERLEKKLDRAGVDSVDVVDVDVDDMTKIE